MIYLNYISLIPTIVKKSLRIHKRSNSSLNLQGKGMKQLRIKYFLVGSILLLPNRIKKKKKKEMAYFNQGKLKIEVRKVFPNEIIFQTKSSTGVKTTNKMRSTP